MQTFEHNYTSKDIRDVVVSVGTPGKEGGHAPTISISYNDAEDGLRRVIVLNTRDEIAELRWAMVKHAEMEAV